MDKKSKEALRRYKKSRKAESSSESSSSSDSDSSSSYSSSDSERRHRHKKSRQPGALRRSSSSSGDERHKRDKERRCQKKLEAKRNHLKRKLKEAKLKKKAAAAAAALSGHSHRALSPATQAKLKKLAERKHLRAASKERREREKEKHRALREREHHHRSSRSPTKITKIRIHQDVNRQKTPPRVHQQLMTREKIIIQTRTRDRTPSAEREQRLRHEHKMRHDDLARERERREREAAREKERAEALARCQERQRERERLAREKLRREEEEKYGKPVSERLLARGPDREMGNRNAFDTRERSIERAKAREVDNPYEHGYVRKHRGDEYEDENERRAILEREELLREREYLARRRELSPTDYAGPSGSRMRPDPRDLYPEDERERAYKRPFMEDGRPGHAMNREQWLSEREIRAREMHEPRDYREIEPDHLYPEERDRLPLPRDRERPPYVARPGADWKRKEWVGSPREWTGDEAAPTHTPGRGIGFGASKRGGSSSLPVKITPPIVREQRPPSETDWDAEEGQIEVTKKAEVPQQREPWLEHDKREAPLETRDKTGPSGRPWGAQDWRERDEGSVSSGPTSYSRGPPGPIMHHSRGERGGGRGGFRRGGHILHGERVPGIHGFRPHHPPALLNLPSSGAFHESSSRFPNKRNMTYTNPNILKKQQAALHAAKAAAQASAVAAATTAVAAAKAAAQSAASGTTNPSILGQGSTSGRSVPQDDKPEAGEIVGEAEEHIAGGDELTLKSFTTAGSLSEREKKSGELSEISDSDDDILNKTEKKAKQDAEDSNSQSKLEKDDEAEEKLDDVEKLGFEEISDGELEEERAAKGVGDALGVDWSSLVAETKRLPSYHTTTAKQKWQAHRIILDVGISMRMAGEDYAKKLLTSAKQQLEAELNETSPIKAEIKDEPNGIKSEIKDEVSSLSTIDEDSQTPVENDESTSDVKPIKEEKVEPKPIMELFQPDPIDVDALPSLACMQVAQRKLQMGRKQLIANACGMNSRALSARQDLKMRRQLCGLPARECPISRNIPATSDKLKAMALAAFQRALEVK